MTFSLALDPSTRVSVHLGLLAAAACACLAGRPAAAAADHGHEPAPAATKAKPAADHGAKPAGEPGAKAAPAKSVDAMDHLRERLAEKLGAKPPADAHGPNLVRVAAKMESPGAHGAGGAHGDTPAPRVASAAPRQPSAAVLAAVEAHRADKASAGVMRAAAGHGSGHEAHWAYGGETGPSAWGGLKPEFSLCNNGTRQSPIDIRGGIAVDLEPVQFDYRASGFNVVDNGHTVQVNIGSGNSIQVGTRRYELVQFHFHRPSEERVDGRQFDMSLHLVHKDPEGRLAVVGLLLDRGAPQPVVQSVWNNLPLERGIEQPATASIDLNHLLPAERGYYTYMGSLTTPPCSEGVLWMVMRQPVPVSPAQIAIFSRLYPMNARPVQSASGRLIKQSQ